ncbi:MAG: four helix bundle protein [Oscillospiraceae bacterium]|nr:four helix bundle protein [Oscillospiraceae bacterium]
MNPIRDYKDLAVWQRGRELVREIYRITNMLPREELFGLSSQLRRAAVSIPSNIAEGYGRQALNDYIRFLKIARGSCYELETQLILCTDLGLLSEAETETADSLLKQTQKLLFSLLRSLELS